MLTGTEVVLLVVEAALVTASLELATSEFPGVIADVPAKPEDG